MQRCRGLYFFQMSKNRVCIRSVFEKIIGPYEVCIFVNIGPFEKTGALYKVCIFVQRGPFGTAEALKSGVLGFIYAL